MATPQEVYDGLMLHATEIADRTKAIESARSQGRDISEDAFMDYMDDAVEFQATATLYREWSVIDESVRPGFKAYVDEQVRQSFDDEGHAKVDAQRAGDVISASSWMEGSYDKTMRYSLASSDRGDAPKRPEKEFGLASGYFMKHKMEYGSKLAAQEKAFQLEQARHEQETAHSVIQQEVAVDEARKTAESIHEQSELTDVVVGFGKDRTFVYGYGERGFDSTIGDMGKEEAKILQGRVKKSGVNHAFGAHDHNGHVRKPENVDWREAGVGERVSFIPVVEQEFRTETRTEVVEKKRIGKDITREVNFQVAVPGSEHQKTILNTETGQQEPAVLFQYDFDPVALGVEATDTIEYRGLTDNRTGGVLSVAVELPKSVADKLLKNIEQNPEYVRDVAEALVLNNSGGRISRLDWDKGRPPLDNPMKPPYKRIQELAPNWMIAVAKPKPGADITSFANGRKGESFEVARLPVK